MRSWNQSRPGKPLRRTDTQLGHWDIRTGGQKDSRMEAVWGLVLTGLAVASGLAEKQQDLTVRLDK